MSLFISRTPKLDVMWFSRSGSTCLWRLKTISKVSCDGGGPEGGGEDIVVIEEYGWNGEELRMHTVTVTSGCQGSSSWFKFVC